MGQIWSCGTIRFPGSSKVIFCRIGFGFHSEIHSFVCLAPHKWFVATLCKVHVQRSIACQGGFERVQTRHPEWQVKEKAIIVVT